jgi:hypothetical protein
MLNTDCVGEPTDGAVLYKPWQVNTRHYSSIGVLMSAVVA